MSESSEYSSEESQGWISWFCELKDHHFLCQVDEEYISDNFNLYGIRQIFKNYNEAMEMILSPEPPEPEDLEDDKYLTLLQQATDIYGLIHARFILTPKGMSLMRDKFDKGTFGTCPRVLCEKQHVLPIGMSEEVRISRVKIYCPRCQEVYIPNIKCNDVDGAFFGCSFAHILLMVYPDMTFKPIQSQFVPRIYGFRIFGKKGSKYAEEKEKKQLTFYTPEELKKFKN